MTKTKSQNKTKKNILNLLSLACVFSLSGCQTAKEWSSALWGGAKVVANTTLGATPIVKDGVEAFDKSMKDWGNETLEGAAQALEKAKFEDVKNNREKYAPVARELAKYCLKKTGNDIFSAPKPASVEVDPVQMPHVFEILNDPVSINRALAGGFLEDKKNALDLFRINFLELSKVITNDDMVQMMQKMAGSDKWCQIYPIFSPSADSSGRRIVARQIAGMNGYNQWENKKIQEAEDRLNKIKYRINQVETMKKDFGR